MLMFALPWGAAAPHISCLTLGGCRSQITNLLEAHEAQENAAAPDKEDDDEEEEPLANRTAHIHTKGNNTHAKGTDTHANRTMSPDPLLQGVKGPSRETPKPAKFFTHCFALFLTPLAKIASHIHIKGMPHTPR